MKHIKSGYKKTIFGKHDITSFFCLPTHLNLTQYFYNCGCTLRTIDSGDDNLLHLSCSYIHPLLILKVNGN